MSDQPHTVYLSDDEILNRVDTLLEFVRNNYTSMDKEAILAACDLANLAHQQVLERTPEVLH